MIKNRAKYFRQPYLANLGCGRTLQGLRAVGALFRGARCIHINHICFHITPYEETGGSPARSSLELNLLDCIYHNPKKTKP
jgi:hypothetical protein